MTRHKKYKKFLAAMLHVKKKKMQIFFLV